MDADNGGQCRFALKTMRRWRNSRKRLASVPIWALGNETKSAKKFIFAQIVGDKLRFTLLSCSTRARN